MQTRISTSIHRRTLLMSALVLAVPTVWGAAGYPQVEVWKDPSCGCCKDWVSHLQKAGFTVKVNESGNNVVRERLGIPQKLGSCHTASVAGYTIEGHVPASDIKRLLLEKPKAVGLAVPGMPVGSPGMDNALYGGRKDPHDVLLVLQDGSSRVYQGYR
jgi:hypothetical protein